MGRERAGGLEKSGWRVTFSSTMNEHQKRWKRRSTPWTQEYALGFFVHYPGSDNADEFAEVVWGSPAAKAGLTAGMKLVAVNGRKWTPDILREAIRGAKGGKGRLSAGGERTNFYQRRD